MFLTPSHGPVLMALHVAAVGREKQILSTSALRVGAGSSAGAENNKKHAGATFEGRFPTSLSESTKITSTYLNPHTFTFTLKTLINRAIRPSDYIFRKSIIYSSTESVCGINFTQLITIHLSEETIFIQCVCSPVKSGRYRYLKHLIIYLIIIVIVFVSNLKDNHKGKAGCQNNPELLGEFIWCYGPWRLSVVLISEMRKTKI